MGDRERLRAAIEAAIPGISPEAAAALLLGPSAGTPGPGSPPGPGAPPCPEGTECSHTRALGERVKELTALHGAATLLRDDALSPEGILERLVPLLPPAFLHPGDATARVVHGTVSFSSPGFAPTSRVLRSPFATGDGRQGSLEVAYLRSGGAGGGEPFLPEERALLDTLAEMVRVALDRRRISSQLDALVDTGRVRLFVLDLDTDLLHFTGTREPGAAAGVRGFVRSREEALLVLHPDDRERVRRTVDEALSPAGGHDDFSIEYRSAFPGPKYEWRHLAAQVIRDGAGPPVRVIGISFNIQRERDLQEELLQSRKIEALGRIAGGVAHDFNNILVAVFGNAQLAADRIPADHPAQRHLEEVNKAGQTAADLVKQILAFGRRQELKPRRVPLGEAVREMDGMLASLFSKRIALRIESSPAVAALVDPGQFRQVVMNLCVNARDAIEGNGTVTLRVLAKSARTAGADGAPGAPRAWAALEVEDTGTGMAPEVRAHIFEPFFTTKPEGKGTGLGLATVHGIVRQSGGFLEVETEVGRGTLIRAFFPAAD